MDQTNRSVVVDEQVIVKWLDVPAPAESVGIDVQRHLRAVGFHATPEFIGAEEIGGAVVAIATAHLSGAADGWEWYCSEVESAARSGSLVGLLERARKLGQLTADLHVALARPSEVFPASRTAIDVESLGDASRSLLAEALQITTGAEGSRLAALADPSRRHHHQPAEKDVASLLQAIDHVGRVVDRRMEGSQSAQIEEWIGNAIDAALAAYLERIGHTDQGDHRLAEHFQSNLLLPLRVMQELRSRGPISVRSATRRPGRQERWSSNSSLRSGGCSSARCSTRVPNIWFHSGNCWRNVRTWEGRIRCHRSQGAR